MFLHRPNNVILRPALRRAFVVGSRLANRRLLAPVSISSGTEISRRFFSPMQFSLNPDQEEKPGEIIKKYTRDLTELAKEGKLDPVIGRADEISRTIQVLSRKSKNNPILIGDPGTGKTAIVSFRRV